MEIDTTYSTDGEMLVHLQLQTDEERALTDDLLLRIGANQHRLRWNENKPRHAEIQSNPATFRLPASHRFGRVTRHLLDHTALLIYPMEHT